MHCLLIYWPINKPWLELHSPVKLSSYTCCPLLRLTGNTVTCWRHTIPGIDASILVILVVNKQNCSKVSWYLKSQHLGHLACKITSFPRRICLFYSYVSFTRFYPFQIYKISADFYRTLLTYMQTVIIFLYHEIYYAHRRKWIFDKYNFEISLLKDDHFLVLNYMVILKSKCRKWMCCKLSFL